MQRIKVDSDKKKHRNRKKMNTLAMTVDLSDDESYDESIATSIRESKVISEPTIMEQLVEVATVVVLDICDSLLFFL